MQLRALRTVVLAVAVILFVGLLAGCGGEQSEGNSEEGASGGNGGSKQQNQNGGGSTDQQDQSTQRERTAREVKIALGTIDSVAAEDDTFTLQPSAEEQGEEPLAFRVRQNTRITIAGEEAELLALQEGQQAKVNYFVVEGTNRARVVEVLGD